MPCSVFVARALRRYRGLDDVPAYAEVGQVGGEPSWWALAQIWDHSRPWSGIQAAEEIGGTVVRPLHVEPPMEAGWYKVQIWTFTPDGKVDPRAGSRGHDFLLQSRRDGRSFVYESDERAGYRRREMSIGERSDEHDRQFGGGCTYRIVRLPR
jgi:hypothetical protein